MEVEGAQICELSERELHEATVTTPVNIAVVKYWGKRNNDLILPTNSSISCTLNQDHLNTKTTVRASSSYTDDRFWLNGIEETISNSPRLTTVLVTLRAIRKEKEKTLGPLAEGEKPLSEWKLHIASENNFPTAAGLASSSSGYAALAVCISKVLELDLTASELSKIARRGSGSACRSLYGGFVEWQHGVDPSGEDSCAVSIAPESHWPELEALILVVSDVKKSTPSTSGMSTTVKTSELFPLRVNEVAPKRIKQMEQAILEKDFNSFATIAMKDSNQFHAVCLDTFPPIFYLNDVSRGIITLVHRFNSQVDPATGEPLGIRAAYTFDAGANAVIFVLKNNVKELVEYIASHFPPATLQPTSVYFPDPFGIFRSADAPTASGFEEYLKATPKTFELLPTFEPGSVRRIIHTNIGDGPRNKPCSASLLNVSGMPRRAKD
ncbi:Diphosphomevalonate decarboxylase [Zancudomyces culisetae]|uniref:Diphosphomevalonate decarboxylase n=1 Tax=Zancudomyces culisetae TaxID=1213189 RepID=A0A1R1PZ26_ZANCU|nr:Diphosphomevalonate decarboxylase [Zancudomyces culisetae]|eukprot:OMH86194.1 Diphosphomevalonate decarboxylase [Zancudomyces culisetae]